MEQSPNNRQALDVDQEVSRRVAEVVSLAFLVIPCGTLVLALLTDPSHPLRALQAVVMAASGGAARVLLARQRARAAAWVLTLVMLSSLALALFSNGGVRAPLFAASTAFIVGVHFLLGPRLAAAAALFSIAIGLAALLAGERGLLPVFSAPDPFYYYAICVGYAFALVVVLVPMRMLRESMHAQRALNDELSARVQERTAELERANTSLLETSENLRAVVDSSPLAIAVAGLDGRLLFWNPAAERVFGWTSAEMVGTVLGAFPEEQRERARAALRRCVEQAGAVELEELRPRKDGRLIETRTLFAPYRSSSSEVSGVVMMTADITEHRRAARALRESLEAQRTLLLASPTAIIGLDAGGRVTSWSPAAERLFGLPAERVQGGPPPPLRDPGGGARSLADQVLDGVQLSGAPAEATRADGSLLRASVSGAPLRDAAGAAAGAVLLVEDVGEQIELRAALQRSATMGALGQLLGAVAHEVRSPLFGITATLDTLEVLHGPDPRMAAVETTLRREADRLALLMSDLLEYGKPAPRELQAARLAVPLAQAVRDTEQLARGAKVAVEVSLPASLQPLRLDEGRMAQVFRNLLENAVQHSPPGGVVRVEAAEELVRARAVVSVRILDSGKGFSPRDLTQLFEPFYTRRKGGTGLGLSIVQRIVEQHGGSVEAANQPSGGAQITVRLPVEAS